MCKLGIIAEKRTFLWRMIYDRDYRRVGRQQAILL